MGIDAQAYTPVGPKQLLGRATGRKALVAIEQYVRQWSQKNQLGPFFASELVSDEALTVSILPVADSISFELVKDGIAVSFRSSNTGPGYHAAVIDLLDHLADSLKLEWRWGECSDLCTDETSYAVERDFAELQRTMANFLRSLMNTVRSTDLSSTAVCIPYGLGLSSNSIACPLGYKTPSWAEFVADADDDEILAEAEQFFIWWTKGRTSQFWLNLLRAVLWQNAQWRAPATNAEVNTAKGVDYIVAKFQEHGQQLPEPLRIAISEYRIAIESDQSPSREGIGYRRCLVTHVPFHGWEINLPGHLIGSPENDRNTVLYQHREFLFRVSSMKVEKKDGSPFNWPSSLINKDTVEANGVKWRVDSIERDQDDWLSQFILMVQEDDKRANLLLLTLTSDRQENLETMRDWLTEIRFSTSARTPG